MQSLRQLRTELVGVRLSPANQSIWNCGGAEINERARLAINDAVNVFPCYVQDVYTSISCTIHSQGVPREIGRVLRVESVSTYRRMPVTDFTLIPSAFTNLLQIHKLPPDASGHIEILYLRRLSEFPEDGAAQYSITESNGYITTGPEVDPRTWPCPGFLEITQDNTISREVVHYAAVTADSFTGVTRAIEGPPQVWALGARLSAVLPVEPEIKSAIMSMATATMYSYWMVHRSSYDRFVAAAELNALTAEELMNVTHLLDQRAMAQYSRASKLPPPSRARSH